MTVDFGLYSCVAEDQLSGRICFVCSADFADQRFPDAMPPGRPRACRACIDEQASEVSTEGFTIFEWSTE
jgi:hypothetical protein